jgi:SpoVK/Ycf46/Vps4 family AAA+-type ATPase
MTEIALKTDGYTPADITTVLMDGAMEPIRRITAAKKFVKTQESKWRPC